MYKNEIVYYIDSHSNCPGQQVFGLRLYHVSRIRFSHGIINRIAHVRPPVHRSIHRPVRRPVRRPVHTVHTTESALRPHVVMKTACSHSWAANTSTKPLTNLVTNGRESRGQNSSVTRCTNELFSSAIVPTTFACEREVVRKELWCGLISVVWSSATGKERRAVE